MAYFGLSNPFMALLNAATETYSQGFKCGKAISTSVTPSYSTASLYADNTEAERVDEFVNAAVEVGTDRLPKVAGEILFGHKVNEDGSETDNANDSSNYVGYGFWAATMEDGVKSYQGVLIAKVKFTEGQTSYQTKGENITFATPTLTGSATALANGDWCYKSPKYDSEAKATVWIKEKLNIELTYTAVTPASGANPKQEGWYELDGTDYVLTTDTEVEDDKTYYAAS